MTGQNLHSAYEDHAVSTICDTMSFMQDERSLLMRSPCCLSLCARMCEHLCACVFQFNLSVDFHETSYICYTIGVHRAPYFMISAARNRSFRGGSDTSFTRDCLTLKINALRSFETSVSRTFPRGVQAQKIYSVVTLRTREPEISRGLAYFVVVI
jgi:hypothetical protein